MAPHLLQAQLASPLPAAAAQARPRTNGCDNGRKS